MIMDMEIKTKLKKIKLVITDVDGVLTDGGMYYNQDGECMKKFNTRDSMGMELLLQSNIKTVLVTREDSKIVHERVKKIKIVDLFSGIFWASIYMLPGYFAGKSIADSASVLPLTISVIAAAIAVYLASRFRNLRKT